jgi:hypothetical protein
MGSRNNRGGNLVEAASWSATLLLGRLLRLRDRHRLELNKVSQKTR